MAQDDKHKSGISWLLITFICVLTMGGGAAAFLFLPSLLPQQATEIALIKGEEGPFKTKPENPGGKIISNQDSKVMRMLGDLTPSGEEIETLLPPSDGAELPPVAIKEPSESDLKTAEVATELGAEVKDTEPANDADTPEKTQETNAKPAPKDFVPEKPAKTIVAEPKKTELAKKPKATKPATANPDEPTYMVQLAAFRKPDIAAEQAGLLLKKHETRLQGASLGTMRVDTGENGVFWRIVTEPLPRAPADTICAALKRAGQECILRKFASPRQ